jgi:hypothetical protein
VALSALTQLLNSSSNSNSGGGGVTLLNALQTQLCIELMRYIDVAVIKFVRQFVNSSYAFLTRIDFRTNQRTKRNERDR